MGAGTGDKENISDFRLKRSKLPHRKYVLPLKRQKPIPNLNIGSII